MTSLPTVEEKKTGSRRGVIFVMGVRRKVGRCACLLYDDGGVQGAVLLQGKFHPGSWLAGTLLRAQQGLSLDAYQFHTFDFSGIGLLCSSSGCKQVPLNRTDHTTRNLVRKVHLFLAFAHLRLAQLEGFARSWRAIHSISSKYDCRQQTRLFAGAQ